MEWVYTFLVAGVICLAGQICLDVFHFSPAQTLSSFVVVGALLSGLGWYSSLIDLGGAGATVPITNFGHILVQGALSGAASNGFIGIFSGVMGPASVGLAAVIVFSFLTTCIFRLRK